MSARRSILAAGSAVALCLAAVPASAYSTLYAEQFYRLYHQHLNQHPEDTMENIVWLEQALKADFANPLNALATIHDEYEWELYRYLFKMHANLLLVRQHLTLGSKFDKFNAYFFNYPWKASNLDSLDKAESAYQAADYYWGEAVEWAYRSWGLRADLERVQAWLDEAYRIRIGDLDYGRIINTQLERVAKVRAQFLAMDPSTY